MIEARQMERALSFTIPDPAPLLLSYDQPLLYLDKVTCGYGEAAVLEDISLQIHKGCRIAVVGDNGAGKTTLLNVLLKEIAPSSGEVKQPGALRIANVHQHH